MMIWIVVAAATALLVFWLAHTLGKSSASRAARLLAAARKEGAARRDVAPPARVARTEEPAPDLDDVVRRHLQRLALLRVAVADAALREPFDAALVQATVLVYHDEVRRLGGGA